MRDVLEEKIMDRDLEIESLRAKLESALFDAQCWKESENVCDTLYTKLDREHEALKRVCHDLVACLEDVEERYDIGGEEAEEIGDLIERADFALGS